MDSDIAVIGVACRFPGASNLEEFWTNLCAGVESISFPEASQLCAANPAYRDRPNFRTAASILPGIDLFDAAFFGYSDREAEIMDPQHRLFLECAWEAFEDAGHVPGMIPGRVGVYAGCGINTYLINNVHAVRGYSPNRTFLESVDDFQLLLASQSDFLTTRISYKFDLRGPSINVQTACSTSLVAVHLACQSLLLGECDMALAGAATVRVPQDGGYLHEDGLVFSCDGHTRAFDVNASGTVFGSGVAAIVLKPLHAAIADGDHVHAVIKASAVNNDGSHKLSFTAPSVDGQAAVINEALTVGGIDPFTIGYIEAHGTATQLGDVIEVEALRRAFASLPPGTCAMGTAKTNVGHLSWTAGMVGLLKAILAVKHHRIPPSLHFRNANTQIDFASAPVYINSVLADWPLVNRPCRAGVSAFGIGGTNAHVVIEEPPQSPRARYNPDRPTHVLALSARTPETLRELVLRYEGYLGRHPSTDVGDVCYTANVGRRIHPVRLAVSGSSVEQLGQALASHAAVGDSIDIAGRDMRPTGDATPEVAFLFTGQGAQYADMGKQLYEVAATFRQVIDRCDEIMRDHYGVPLRDVLFRLVNRQERVHSGPYVPAALFAFQAALANLWMSWGVKPAAVMGHSAGEYAAAYVAGVFSLEDGLRLSAERGQLFDSLVTADGLMVTANVSEEVAAGVIAPYSQDVAVAAINGPLSTVISGRRSAVDEVCRSLAKLGATVRLLEVSRAGHSPLTDNMLDGLRQCASNVRLSTPRVPLVSNLTGGLAGEVVASPDYWCRHTREPVRFADGMRTLADQGVRVFLEIGPDPILCGMGAFCMRDSGALWIPSLRRPTQVAHREWDHLANAVAKLFTAGVHIDWRAFDAGYERRRISLPTYPFQSKRHWIEPDPKLQSQPVVDAPRWARSLFEIRWSLKPLPFDVESTLAEVEPKGLWLVFTDKEGGAERIADALEARGFRCVRVTAGGDFHYANPRAQVNPHSIEHAACLLELIGEAPVGIAYFWGDDCKLTSKGQLGGAITASVLESCVGLVTLVKALCGTTAASMPRLAVVSRGAQCVITSDNIDGLTQAPLWSLSRVIGMEHPDLRLTRVDLDARPFHDETEHVANELLRPGEEDAVALRDGRRYVARLCRVDVPISKSSADGPLPVDPSGAYLITGGFGGIGLIVAEWLVANGVRALVLMGRSSPKGAALESIERLRRRGIVVSIALADVADSEQLATAMANLPEHPPLMGVIHAAGVVEDAVVRRHSSEGFLKVLRPKVQGAWNLHRWVLKFAPQLKQFVLFSSAASLIGNAGQASHAAANGFLDALAHYRRAKGQPSLSINWGAWTEVGELLRNSVARDRLDRLGFDPITCSDGLSALAHALCQPLSQLGIVPMNWERFLSEFQLQYVAFFENFATTARNARQRSSADLRRTLTAASPPQREALLINIVRTHAAYVLGSGQFASESVDDDRSLLDYGLDSLAAIELCNKLQAETGQRLSSTIAMECPTVREIAARLAALPCYGTTLDGTSRQSLSTTAASTRNLSFQQRRWLSLVKAGYGARVVPIVFEAKLHREAFRGALVIVAERHELLRYSFPSDKIVVLPAEHVVPQSEEMFEDLQALDFRERRVALGAAVKQCWATIPDPAVRAAWAVQCLEYPNDRFLLLLSLHHLAFDGTSLTTFVSELRSAYGALIRNAPPALSHVSQYHDYVKSQQHYMAHEIEEDRAFFQGLYSSLLTTTVLAGHRGFDRSVPYPSGRHTGAMITGLWAEVQRAGSQWRTTPFAVLLAAYAVLLSEIVCTNEIVVAMIVNGRSDAKFGSTIGPFTAPFPVRVTICTQRFADLAMQCHRAVAEITSRSRYPVADLVDHVAAFRGFPVDSYFSDAGINFTSYRRNEDGAPPFARVLEVLGPIVEPEFEPANSEELARIPGLHLVLEIFDGELRANFWYHTDRFTSAQVTKWSSRYMQILSEAVARQQATSVVLP